MPQEWACEIVARMHKARITNNQLAKKAGYTPQYVSMILTGKRDTLNARNKIVSAVSDLEADSEVS